MKLVSERGAMYGLEMVDATSGEIKRGTVYPTLQRMTEKKYLRSHEVPRVGSEVGAPRRMYEITEFGNRVLDKNSALERRMNEQLLELEEAAELMFVSVGKLLDWIDNGEIEAIEGMDGEVRIPSSSLLSEETKDLFETGRRWETISGPEEAINHGRHWLGKAIESNPHYGHAIHELGRMYFTFGRYYEAVTPLEESVELNPDAMPPSMNLGMNFFEMQRYKDAEKCFRNVVQKNPDFAQGWYKLGLSLSMLGFHDRKKALDAIEALIRTRALNPNSPETFWFLSRLYVLPTYGISDFVSAEHLAEEIKDDFPEWAEEIKFLISLNSHSAARVRNVP